MSSTYTIGMASNLDSFASSASAPGTPPELLFYFLFVTYDAPAPPLHFAISQVSADKKARRAARGPLASGLTHEQRELFPQGPGNPTAAVILQARPLPGSVVRVEVTVAGKARDPEDFDFAPSLGQGQVTLALRRDQPPRLALAVNTTFVARPAAGNFRTPGAAEVKAVLRHIHGRLLDGPAAAWRGSDGSPELPFSPGTQDSDEETWAKLITEMLITAPYGVPETLYGFGVKVSNDEVFLKYLDDADPGYSLGYECQHLITMAAMTRGIVRIVEHKTPTGDVKRGLDQFTAGSDSSGVVKRLGGRFLPAASVASVNDAIKAGITPGSSWVYNGHNKSGVEVNNDGAAHIGFVVRVDLTGKRVQTFDTGGLNVTGRATDLTAGTFDDPWVNATEQVPGPFGNDDVFKGVCVLPEAPNLAQAVERMRRARPLGFARLVLLRGHPGDKEELSDNQILYAGPLLRMHHDGGNGARNLSFAAYLWSLREHPGGDAIQAMWLLYTPRGALAKVALHGHPSVAATSPRQLTVAQLVRAAGFKTPATQALGLEALGVADYKSKPDGSVAVVRRFDQHGQARLKPSERPKALVKLPWGTRSGTVTLADADLDDLPYFRGA